MNRKLLGTIICTASVISLLTGCGKSKTETASTTATTTAKSVASTPGSELAFCLYHNWS